jgi:hypothetical protein
MDPGIKIRWAVTLVLGIVMALVASKLLREDEVEPPPAAEAPASTEARSRTITLSAESPRGPSLEPPPKAPGIPPGDTDSEAADAESPEADEPDGTPPEADPSDHAPFLVDAPESLTAEARRRPLMSEIGPNDVRYSSITEAHQIFAPFEDTLQEADPLTPDLWKAALETHRERNAGVLKRADFLRRSGYPEEAGEMMVEWSRLYGLYQAKAYGR